MSVRCLAQPSPADANAPSASSANQTTAVPLPAATSATAATPEIPVTPAPAAPSQPPAQPPPAQIGSPSVADSNAQQVQLYSAMPQANLPSIDGNVAIDVTGLRPLPSAQDMHRAERLRQAGDANAALQLLGDSNSAVAALLRGRVHLQAGRLPQAQHALQQAADDGNLRAYVAVERGRLALAMQRPGEAVAWLGPILATEHPWAAQAVLSMAEALAEVAPEQLVLQAEHLQQQLRDNSGDAQGQFLESLALAETRLGHSLQACVLRTRRFVEHPAGKSTPSVPPVGCAISAEQWLRRVERLLEVNRNEAAQQAIDALPESFAASLSEVQACRLAFARGMVARKRHHYQTAEAALGWVMAHCQDTTMVRRAAYVQAKVISIQDGLRALPAIEAFATRYQNHSMVDDVLFWAGDSLQRRGRDADAAAYYRRVVAMPTADDHCVEAGWRLGWMAFRAGQPAQARKAWQASLRSRCPMEPSARGRIRYWLGRMDEAEHRLSAAKEHYRAVLKLLPLHFYAQQALTQLLPLENLQGQKRLLASLQPPAQNGVSAGLCPAGLADKPAFAQGLYLWQRGLYAEARASWLSLEVAGGPQAAAVLPRAGSNKRAAAKAVGKAPPATKSAFGGCGARQASLLLAQLLELAGGHREAHVRLLRDFAQELQQFPTPLTLPLWRQAYPLAFREPLAQAETASGLPPFLLQAVAREESGFDAEVVSWAEAVGLTQLLLTSGQMAGRSLQPQVRVQSIEALLEPNLNAQLGGALLGLYGRRLRNSWPLALAAYNGGQDTARAWHKRFAGVEFAIFAEEMTIRETRTYVQRVLQTFGIYRWLYAEQPPALPADPVLPSFADAARK